MSPTVELSHQLSLSLPHHCSLHLSSEHSRDNHHGDLAVAWDNKDQVGSRRSRRPWEGWGGTLPRDLMGVSQLH